MSRQITIQALIAQLGERASESIICAQGPWFEPESRQLFEAGGAGGREVWPFLFSFFLSVVND